MSTTIDQRVVEMRFDNDQFERNISQSTESLEKLKQALNLDNAAKNFETLEKAAKGLNLSSVTESVQTVSQSFNALESVANGVFTRLGWNIAQWVEKWVREFSKFSLFGQSGAGWEKYADLTESTQTIVAAGYALGDVEKALERLNWYTDETSYNFTDMANNIGKFTAQGINLETAATAMQGISNWAARSGQHAAEAGRAMYNLSQALSVGSVKLIDWKSIENANMATKEFKQTVIDTAVAMGTLEKYSDGTLHTIKKGTEVTAASFSSTLSEAWFTSDVLLSVLEKYGNATNELYAIGKRTGLTATKMLQALKSYQEGTDEWANILATNGKGYVSAERFGEMLENLGREENKLGLESFRMAQEALTFKQAMDSVADAASTSWMNIFNKLFGTFEDARGLWTNVANDFYDIFVEPVNDLLGFVTRNFDSGFTQIESLITDTGIDAKDFEKALLDIADSSGILSDEMKEAFESGTKSFYDFFTDSNLIEQGWNGNLINQAIERLTGGTISSVKNAEEVVQEYGDLVNQVIRGNFGNGETRIKKLTEAGYEYEKVQSLVNKVLRGGKVAVEDFSEAELASMGITEDQIAQLNDLFDAETDAGEAYQEALALLNKRSGRDLLAEGLHSALHGIANVGFIIRDIISSIVDGPATSFVRRMIVGFNTLSVSFSNWTEKILEDEELLSSIGEVFDGIFGVIGAGFGVIKSFFTAIVNGVKSLLGFRKAIDISSVLSKVSGWLKKAADNIKAFSAKVKESEVIQNIINGIATAFGFVYINIKNAIDFIDSKLPKGTNLFERLGTAVSNMYQKFKANPKIQKYFGWLIEAAEKLVEKFPEALNKVRGEFDKFINYLDEKTDGGTNILGGIVDMLGDVKTAILGLFSFNDVDWGSFFGASDPNQTKTWWQNLSSGFQEMLKKDGEEGKAYANILKGVTDGVSAFGESIKGSYWRIKSWGGGILDNLAPVFDYIKEMDLSNLTSTVALGAMAGGFLRLSSGFEKLGQAAVNFTNPFNTLSQLLGEVKKIAKEYRAQIKANSFRTIAISIAILAGSILVLLGAVYLLSKNVNSIKELGPGLLIVGGLLVFMAGFFWAISAINKKYGGIGNAAGITAVFLSMSLSLIAVIAAIKILTKFSDQITIGAIVKLGLIVLALIGVIKALQGGTRIGHAFGTLISLVSFAAFLMMFAVSIFTLDRVISGLKNPGKTFGTLIVTVLALMALMTLTEKISVGKMASLLALPMTLILVGIALEQVAKMDWDLIKSKALRIVGALVGLLIVYGLVNMIPANGGNWQAGASIVGIALSLLIIAKAVQMIMNVPFKASDPNRLNYVMGFLLAALMIMSLAAGYLSSSMGGKNALQASTSMISLAGALLIMSGAIILLSSIDSGKAIGAAAALLVVMLGIAAVVGASENAGKAAGTIIALAGLISVVVLALYVLQNIELPGLVKAGVALGLMMAVLGVFLGFASYYSGGLDDLLLLLGGALIIVAIAGALALVAQFTQNMDPGKIIAIAGAISMIAVALGIMFAIIGRFGFELSSILLSIAAVFVGFGVGLLATAAAFKLFISTMGNMDLSEVEALGIKIGALVPSIISGFLIGLFHAIPQIGYGLYTAFKAGLQYLGKVWEDAKTLAGDLWSKFIEGIKGIDWGELAQTIWEKFKEALGWVGGKIQDAANWLPGAVVGYSSDPYAAYKKHAGISGEEAGREFADKAGEVVSAEGLISPSAIEQGALKTEQQATKSAATLGETIAEEASTGFNENFWTEIQSVIGGESGIDLSSLIGNTFDLSETGTSSGESFIDKLTSTVGNYDFGSTGKEVGSEIVTGTESEANESVFSSIGDRLMQGLKSSFNAIAGYNIGYEVGSSIKRGTEESVSINSPSRAFYEIGEYCVEGLVNAVRQLSGTAADAGWNLGTEVLTSTAASLAGMYSILEGQDILVPQVGLVGGSGTLMTHGLNGGTYGFGTPSGFRTGATSSVTTNAPVFNIYQQPGQDSEALARIINRELGRMYVR